MGTARDPCRGRHAMIKLPDGSYLTYEMLVARYEALQAELGAAKLAVERGTEIMRRLVRERDEARADL
jgi:hypothetical protein